MNVQSKGVTSTERELAALCERSFLKLWSYPNPYKADGKELCDVLAIFEDHVFIFFDRHSHLPVALGPDRLINWNRWKRRTIDAQIRAAHGAVRYIKSGRTIFLDKDLTRRLPLRINLDRAIFDKIIVAHGAKEACKAFAPDNVYGSLGICYGRGAGLHTFPFIIDINKEMPVHVFDSHNLPIVFRELDTVYDFSSYLEAKREAVNKFDALIYCGEEDLLAHYFLNFDDSKRRHFIGAKEVAANWLMIGEGEWKDFIDLDAYKNKKLADEVSYIWDELIQRTCQNALDGTLLGNSDLLNGQSAIREMAKEPRFMRRTLSEKILQVIRNFPQTSQPIVRNLTFLPSFYEEKGYVFLQLKAEGILDYEKDYRPKRRALLEIACGVARNKFEQLRKVIGIAIDAPKFSRRNSEDFLLMDCEGWTAEKRDYYARRNTGLDFFETSGLTIRELKVTEFPAQRSDHT